MIEPAGMALSEAEKKRAQREVARKKGKCIICRRRKARPDRVTCAKCSKAATKATAERRKKAKG